MRLEPSWRQPVGIFLILLLIAGWACSSSAPRALIDGAPALGPRPLLSGRRDRLDPAAEAAAALDGNGALAQLPKSLERRNGASDGARTRDLRRDRPAL